MPPPVSVGIVTYQSAPHLPRCLQAVGAQSLRPREIVVWDNASTDGSVVLAREAGAVVHVSPANVGFAGGADELVRRTRGAYLLLLNPDTCLAPDYVERVVRAAESDPGIGSVTGKLLRPGQPPVIDSAGHVIFRSRWVVNRGTNEPDRGQYDQPGEVFGVCAAAALYRRAMLEDVQADGRYFDPAFFAYLEDVDLDWRARLRGWRAYYEPAAVAIHERGHRGRGGVRNPAVLRHSLKNRYLLMLRNDRLLDVARDFPAIVAMEVVRLCHYAAAHPSALRGLVDLVPLIPGALRARREIQRRRRAPPEAVRGWYEPYPVRRQLAALLGRSAAFHAGRGGRVLPGARRG